jgi:hypothetical protein
MWCNITDWAHIMYFYNRGGFTIGIYKIFKAHLKVCIDKFLENEKAVLIVQKAQSLFILSKF